ncbi:LuxR C-terminal-related transcriptional regulator [Marinomonas aquiplantarum]|uniref:Regulatory LuxR family protein n=1 Tax=Marinomonas aquiplantarum TaxID=491951 RepID=A0A366CZ72_9GAMM|nr:LuxR C-terminal-related transcriptional regulator [Marinomonas aquiplantarum]RBO82539.1 regulatory LuxR family protein [Marinomonas aquiplantarum]
MKDILSPLYETIINQNKWEYLIEILCNRTKSKSGFITLREKKNSRIVVPNQVNIDLKSPLIFGLKKEDIYSYINEYIHIDPWTLIELKHHPFTPYNMAKHLPIEELSKSVFWKWLQPQDINDAIVLELYSCENHWISLNLLFKNTSEEDLNDKLSFLTYLQPKLREVWELGQRFRASQASSPGMDYFVQQQELPSLLMDEQNKLVSTNSHMEELIGNKNAPIALRNQTVYFKEKNIRESIKTAFSSLTPKTNTEIIFTSSDWNYKCALLGEQSDLIGKNSGVKFIQLLEASNDVQGHTSLIWELEFLTSREQQLVKVLANGGRVVDFERTYNIAKSTAHSHWSNVKKKLVISDRSEIVAMHHSYLKNQ